MQQLETYKLKHIDKDDPFSPDTLNANTDAVAGHLARLDAAIPRIAWGTYTGDGTRNRKFDLDFTPKLVYVGLGENGCIYINLGSYYGGLALEGIPSTDSGSHVMLEIVEGGFRVSYQSSSCTANTRDSKYRWFAIG